MGASTCAAIPAPSRCPAELGISRQWFARDVGEPEDVVQPRSASCIAGSRGNPILTLALTGAPSACPRSMASAAGASQDQLPAQPVPDDMDIDTPAPYAALKAAPAVLLPATHMLSCPNAPASAACDMLMAGVSTTVLPAANVQSFLSPQAPVASANVLLAGADRVSNVVPSAALLLQPLLFAPPGVGPALADTQRAWAPSAPQLTATHAAPHGLGNGHGSQARSGKVSDPICNPEPSPLELLGGGAACNVLLNAMQFLANQELCRAMLWKKVIPQLCQQVQPNFLLTIRPAVHGRRCPLCQHVHYLPPSLRGVWAQVHARPQRLRLHLPAAPLGTHALLEGRGRQARLGCRCRLLRSRRRWTALGGLRVRYPMRSRQQSRDRALAASIHARQGQRVGRQGGQIAGRGCRCWLLESRRGAGLRQALRLCAARR